MGEKHRISRYSGFELSKVVLGTWCHICRSPWDTCCLCNCLGEHGDLTKEDIQAHKTVHFYFNTAALALRKVS